MRGSTQERNPLSVNTAAKDFHILDPIPPIPPAKSVSLAAEAVEITALMPTPTAQHHPQRPMVCLHRASLIMVLTQRLVTTLQLPAGLYINQNQGQLIHRRQVMAVISRPR